MGSEKNGLAAPFPATVRERVPKTDRGLPRIAGTDDSLHVASSAPRYYRLIGTGQTITDGLCILVALLVSYLLRFQSTPFGGYSILVVTMPFMWVAIFRSFTLHTPQLMSAAEEFRRTIAASTLGIMIVVMTSFWTKAALSRVWVALTLLIVLGLEFATRRLWRGYMHRLKKNGTLTLRTIIVGANGEGRELAQALADPEEGFEPIAYVATGHEAFLNVDLPIAGTVADLDALLADYGIDCLFIAATDLSQRDMINIAQIARRRDVEIRIAAHVPEILSPRVTVQPVGGMMALAVRPVKLSRSQLAVKRTFDVAVAFFALILFSPLLAAAAVAIKVSSPGPVFFRQSRVTKGGKSFNMFKFRTMRENAHSFLEENGIDPSTAFFKMGEDDPRITKVGAFLRKTSIDELPQLLNVLKGGMSLVGPRPLPAEQVAANLELLERRHEVPAGVTGWWQIKGRSSIEDPDEAVRMDLFYIENWSLTLDIYIVLKTFGAVLGKRGAY